MIIFTSGNIVIFHMPIVVNMPFYQLIPKFCFLSYRINLFPPLSLHRSLLRDRYDVIFVNIICSIICICSEVPGGISILIIAGFHFITVTIYWNFGLGYGYIFGRVSWQICQHILLILSWYPVCFFSIIQNAHFISILGTFITITWH